jgi:hypothetical protein
MDAEHHARLYPFPHHELAPPPFEQHEAWGNQLFPRLTLKSPIHRDLALP